MEGSGWGESSRAVVCEDSTSSIVQLNLLEYVENLAINSLSLLSETTHPAVDCRLLNVDHRLIILMTMLMTITHFLDKHMS